MTNEVRKFKASNCKTTFKEAVTKCPSVNVLPIFISVHGTATFGDGGLVAISHRGDLLALIWMNQKNDFIVSHLVLPSD